MTAAPDFCQIGKPEQIDRLIAAAASMNLPGRVELLRAVRSGSINLMEGDRQSAAPMKALEQSTRPVVFVIGDDDYASTGPAGWAAWQRLSYWARFAMVHATGADAPSYRLAIGMALLHGRMLLIETEFGACPRLGCGPAQAEYPGGRPAAARWRTPCNARSQGAAMNAPDDARTWRDAVQRVNDSAAGVIDVSIINATTGAMLMADALLGDQVAATLLLAVTQAAARIKRAPRQKPALCVCCPRSVRRVCSDTVFGVASPSVPNPAGVIGFVFCDRCAGTPGSLAAKATEGLRRIWPDLRPITITDPVGGHA